MSSFDITQSETGEFLVRRMEPVILGRFADRAFAELFKAVVSEGSGASVPAPTPATAIDELPAFEALGDQPVQLGQVPEAGKAAAEAPERTAPLPAPAEPEAAPKLSQEELDTVFCAARPRLIAGERLSDVALDLGVPYGQLRSKWALWRKVHPDARPPAVPEPAEPVTGGDGDGERPDRVARRSSAGWSDEEELELLAILGGDAPVDRMVDFAAGVHRTVAECRAHGERLLRRGVSEALR